MLQRVVTTIKFLAESGQAGDWITRNDNLLEFLSQFDPFLAAHLEKDCNKGKGSVSYLSSTTCDQLIAVIGKEVLSIIIGRPRNSTQFL